jgi:hypothetical protein
MLLSIVELLWESGSTEAGPWTSFCRATVQALGSGILMVVVAYPLIAWLTSQLTRLSDLKVGRLGMMEELARGSLFMLPYLWTYFFALEKIARQGRKNLPPQLLEPHLH